MPVIASKYRAPIWLKNGHVSTIYSGLLRKVEGVEQERERLELEDGDFMDLDWSYSSNKSDKLVITLHGLEGNAQRPYMLGSAKYFNSNGFDVLSVNFRGCSGEKNRLYRSYHSGATEDLKAIVDHVLSKDRYPQIFIKGFSLGGNVTLKYLGERNDHPKEIKGAMAVSVPCYLYGSMLALHTLENSLYARRFLDPLMEKLKGKQEQFPEIITVNDLARIKTLKDFDDVYTSKAHGFLDALDYYENCSSLQFLTNVAVPTLILNASNDTFLSAECYPEREANNNGFLYLEQPDNGGHVAFYQSGGVYYNEKRGLEFFNSLE